MCTPDAHLHHFRHPAFPDLDIGVALVLDYQQVALITDKVIGQRLCDLLNRHGLADTPTFISGAWPPPTFEQRAH